MASTHPFQALSQELRQGSPRALSRLITQVENRAPGYEQLLDELHPRTGGALRLGVTGPPGAGKSTLVERLTREHRAKGRTVAVLACDPSSPFSGGALLGDRVRMAEVADDAGVFIRSVASRDSLGGLSRSTEEVSLLFEAFGFDVVLLETVGVGQAEVDVMHLADTVVVTIVPQSGDVVQAMKAGLMEIADVFCINKSDQPGADLVEQSLHQLLSLSMRPWPPPIVQTVASRGTGIDALCQAVARHQQHLGEAGLRQRRARRAAHLLRQTVEARLHKDLWDAQRRARLEELAQRVADKHEPPYAAANRLLQSFA